MYECTHTIIWTIRKSGHAIIFSEDEDQSSIVSP